MSLLNGCGNSKLSNDGTIIIVPSSVKIENRKGPIKIPSAPVTSEDLTLSLRKSELDKTTALNSCVKQINRSNKLMLLRGNNDVK
jgi:hypothetical protein